VLILQHRLIPPSLHFKTPNPQIDFENSPFIVNTGLCEWKNNGFPLRAGVSSFGIGGTNAHAVLEEAPRPVDSPGTGDLQLLLLSARTPVVLERMTGNLVTHLEHHPGINITNMAYTLMMGRKHFKHRKIAVCSSGEEALEAFSARGDKALHTSYPAEENQPVIFMFPGQGSQYIDMGLGLYETKPVFRQEMDRCFGILKPLLNLDIKEIIYPPDPSDRSDPPDSTHRSGIPINQTEIAQPLLFCIEYA
ncbi:MAG: type I polyketide synthase, partial [bacterium]|nr:type I polyketide synthase [bacterium]